MELISATGLSNDSVSLAASSSNNWVASASGSVGWLLGSIGSCTAEAVGEVSNDCVADLNGVEGVTKPVDFPHIFIQSAIDSGDNVSVVIPT